MTNWVHVTHVADWRSDFFVMVFDEVVDLLVGGVASWNQMILVEVGIVRTSCVNKFVPNPLKL